MTTVIESILGVPYSSSCALCHLLFCDAIFALVFAVCLKFFSSKYLIYSVSNQIKSRAWRSDDRLLLFHDLNYVLEHAVYIKKYACPLSQQKGKMKKTKIYRNSEGQTKQAAFRVIELCSRLHEAKSLKNPKRIRERYRW